MKNIGLALSGGGLRACVFHLGVLKYLIEVEMIKNVKMISTVSGGSVAPAILIGHSKGNSFPKSNEVNTVLTSIKSTLTKTNLELQLKTILFGLLLTPILIAILIQIYFDLSFLGSIALIIITFLIDLYIFMRGKADILGFLFAKLWKISGDINSIDKLGIRWFINATCYETGKNWRFDYKRMGDHKTNYVKNPNFPVSLAVASSAAVPGLVGPLYLKTKNFKKWYKFDDNKELNTQVDQTFNKFRLWDGGVYDNLGIEGLYKIGKGIREGLDYLLISDASAELKIESGIFSKNLPFYIAPLRLVDTTTDQVRSLRLRDLYHHFKTNKSGNIIKIGKSIKMASSENETNISFDSELSSSQIEECKSFDTTFRKLSSSQFDDLLKHGYETAKASINLDHLLY